MIRRALRLGAAILLLGLGTPSAARPFTVEDLLHIEGFGAVSFDPSGRWLVFARLEPFLAMSRFDMVPQADVLRSRLYRVDLRLPWRAVPLLADPKPGVISYGFSTDGSRLAVGRFSDGRWQLGIITMSTGVVRWLPLTPDYNPFYTTMQWVSDNRLVAIVNPDGHLPWLLHRDGYAAEALPERWKATRSGTAAAVTVIGSGQFSNAGLPAPVNALVSVDARSGRSTTLAKGRFLSMSLAPDRAHIALIERGARTSMPLDRALSQMDRPFREVPVLYDLGHHEVWRPCPDCDLLGDAAWSADSHRLAIFARRAGQDWAAAKLFTVNLNRRSMNAVQSGGVTPAITESVDGTVRPAFHWRRDELLLFGRPIGDQAGRADWYALDGAHAIPLTSSLAHVGPDMTTIAGCQTALTSADGISCLDGRTPRLLFGKGLRLSNGRAIGWTRASDQIVMTGNVLPGRAVRVAPSNRIEDVEASPTGDILVVRQTASDGVKTLSLVSRDHASDIAVANLRLRDVDPAKTIPVVTRSGGRKVTSWLYLPPGARDGHQFATVVIPYPGLIYGTEPPADQQLGTSRFYTNAQLLAAHGFAVLLPSLSPVDKPPAGELPYAAELDPIVDAAIATGYVDPDRIGLWGHSYGGYTVALIASQSQRYKAVVAQAGFYDLGAVPGALMPRTELAPQFGLPIGLNFAYVETGQGRMGAPPWSAPMRYIRNSPTYRADKISAPMMIVAADQDVTPLSQAEQLFSALYRQDKDAELVTYWGEGHVIASPGNVRDLYRRAFNWFDRFLGSPDHAPGPPAELASADRSKRAPNSPR